MSMCCKKKTMIRRRNVWSMKRRAPDKEDHRGLIEVVQKDCQACKLNREDTMDCSRWRKLIKDDDRDR